MNKCETELVEGLKNGEPLAYAEFARLYGSRIYDVHCWLCGDSTVAEDLAQETMVALFRGISKFEGRASLYTWVHKLATRIARRYVERSPRSCVPLTSIPNLEAPEDTYRQASLDILQDLVREALKALPREQGECIVLHCIRGLSLPETAKALGRPLGTVKWQLAQGLHAMRGPLRKVGANADGL